MCELFAINAATPVAANGYLAEFFDHSHRHPHGWGITWRTNDPDNPVVLLREPKAAFESDLVRELLLRPIVACHLQAHIRNATCGTVSEKNCHPFLGSDVSGRDWTLIHNGILFNEGLLWGYTERAEGDTDSERVMLFLMDVLDEAIVRAAGDASLDVTFPALAGALSQLGNLNRLNVILDDGTYTYVHTNTDEPTLWFCEKGQGIVFSTQPLGGEGERGAWKPVPQRRLIAYRDGRLVRTSAPHGNVFCEAILDLRRAFGDVWDPSEQAANALPVQG